jgi:phosphoribosylformylglycinamidine cyclo-ligase
MAHGVKSTSRQSVLNHDRYAEAGVDTDEADAGLLKLKDRILDTWPPAHGLGAVKLDLGYFANVVDIGGQGIAISTDGVGSKTMIATMLGKYDTVGIDCVAMNVNDIICVGARPVSMVDYIAIEKVEAGIIDEISIGLARGAKLAGISICGGETAQLKGIVKGLDLAGTAIGHVPLDRILVGQDLCDGDVVIGVESNGVHSNGFSLARHAFFKKHRYKLSHRLDDLGCDLGTELLKPTHIYVKEVLNLLSQIPSVKALAHITSDGFLNLTRVKADVSYVIDTLPPVPPVFSIIQRLGEVEESEMFAVYNMGIGFCAVVSEADAGRAISILGSNGKRAWRIGFAVADAARTVSLPKQKLIGRGKHFRRDNAK